MTTLFLFPSISADTLKKCGRQVSLILVGVSALMSVFTQTAKAQTTGKIPGGIDEVLASYFKISNDLATHDISKSAVDAKQLVVDLNGVSLVPSGTNEQKAWLKHADDLKFAAWHINNGTSLTEQRNYFWMLSRYLYKVLKENNFNHIEIYKLRNGTDHTFWLAQSGEAASPYAVATDTELAEVIRPASIQKLPK